jgi:hypothetical protein
MANSQSLVSQAASVSRAAGAFRGRKTISAQRHPLSFMHNSSNASRDPFPVEVTCLIVESSHFRFPSTGYPKMLQSTILPEEVRDRACQQGASGDIKLPRVERSLRSPGLRESFVPQHLALIMISCRVFAASDRNN